MSDEREMRDAKVAEAFEKIVDECAAAHKRIEEAMANRQVGPIAAVYDISRTTTLGFAKIATLAAEFIDEEGNGMLPHCGGTETTSDNGAEQKPLPDSLRNAAIYAADEIIDDIERRLCPVTEDTRVQWIGVIRKKIREAIAVKPTSDNGITSDSRAERKYEPEWRPRPVKNTHCQLCNEFVITLDICRICYEQSIQGAGPLIDWQQPGGMPTKKVAELHLSQQQEGECDGRCGLHEPHGTPAEPTSDKGELIRLLARWDNAWLLRAKFPQLFEKMAAKVARDTDECLRQRWASGCEDCGWMWGEGRGGGE